MSARRVGVACWWLLVALQPLWHAIAPSGSVVARVVVTAAFLAPMAWPSWMLWGHRANALFWSALVSLFYFCHGVMEAWASPPVRAFALTEVALCLGLVGAVGVDGWQRRKQARQAAERSVS
ncbi:MAG: DUF2069 domain-containing protein [Xanthomonadales bacterium]|nr:DUF2069 domain-containing protein [Xanthomonadales bacterium]